MAESGFFGALGRGFAPEGQRDTPMSQALLQLGAGLLSNPHGNLGANIGASISPALDRYNQSTQIEGARQDKDAALQAKRMEMMAKGITLQIGAIDTQIQSAALGNDKAAVVAAQARKQALTSQLASLYGVTMPASGSGSPQTGIQGAAKALGASAQVTGKAGPTVDAAQALGQMRPAAADPAAVTAADRIRMGALVPSTIADQAKLVDMGKLQQISQGSYGIDATGGQQYFPKLPDGMMPGSQPGTARTIEGVVGHTGAMESAKARAQAAAQSAVQTTAGVDDAGRPTIARTNALLGAPNFGGGGPSLQSQGAAAAAGFRQPARGAAVPTGQSSIASASDKAFGELLSQDVAAIKEREKTISANSSNLNTMRKQLELVESGKVRTGALAPVWQVVNKLAATVGVASASENASDTEIMSTLLSIQSNKALSTQPGVQSDGDADRFKAELPTFIKEGRANQYILRYSMALAQRENQYLADRNAMIRKAVREKVAPPWDEFEAHWRHPDQSVYNYPTMRGMR